MPKKLKNLKITKVDFVDAGANPDADIVLYKRRDGGGTAPGEGTPSTPDEEPAAVKPEEQGIVSRMIDWFTGAVEKRGETVENAAEELAPGAAAVEKGAETFGEALGRQGLDKITDDMWNLCYALNSSLCSILTDEELDAAQKQAAMLESLEEFTTTTKEAIPNWAGGNPVGLVAKISEGAAQDHLADHLAEELAEGLRRVFDRMPVPGQREGETTEPKGDEPNMRIDKNKLTQRELAFMEAIEKKAGIPDDAPAEASTAAFAGEGQDPQPTAKSAPAAPVAASEPVSGASVSGESDEDIYKRLPPQFRQEFEALRKFRQDAEDAKLREIAGSYGIIGKTEDQLFPVFKSLKAASPEAYDTMIATLNDAKASVEKSGVFGEVGRTGNGTVTGGGAVKEAEAKAAELMKSRSGLTRQQAIDAVLQENPELAKRYETEE